MPEEPIKGSGRFMKIVLFERSVHFLCSTRKARKDPAICQREIHLPKLCRRRNPVAVLHVPQNEPCCIPDLRGEVTIAFQQIIRNGDICTWSTHSRECEAD